MARVTVRVQTLGEEWLALALPKEITAWQVKTMVRSVRGTPRRRQHLLAGDRFVTSAETLMSFAADVVELTLVVCDPTCAGCGVGQRRLRRCSGCNDVYYCDRSCQQMYWQEHKRACRGCELLGQQR